MLTTAVCTCGKIIKVNEDMAGEVIHCMRCGQAVRVPEASRPAPPPAPPPEPEKPDVAEKSKEPAASAAAPAPAEDSAREYVYWLLIFAFVPLVFMLTDNEQRVSPKDRLERTIRRLPPEDQKNLRRLYEDVENGDVRFDDFVQSLPDHRMDGAFLPRNTDVHWLFILGALLVFWLLLSCSFSGTRTLPHHLLGVGLVTATVGVSVIFLIHMSPVGIFVEMCMLSAHSDAGDFLVVVGGFTLGVGFFEELAKLLPVLWYFRRYRTISWRRACLWGLASGAGFGISEGWLYSAEYYNGTEGLDIYIVRFASCVALHAVWTASAALALFKNQDVVRQMLKLPPPGASRTPKVGGRALAELQEQPVDWMAVLMVLLRVLAVVMFLHGLYDAALTKQRDILALITALVSFGWLAYQVETERRLDYAPAKPAAA